MCGRFSRGCPAYQIADLYDVDHQQIDLEASWNVAPTEDVAILRHNADRGRVLEAARWGLVPHWSDGPDSRYSMINARAGQ